GRRRRRAADRPRRAVRPVLCADLRRGLHLPDHGAGAGLPADRHPGPEGRMSAAQWRRAMNSGAGRNAWSRPASIPATTAPAGAAMAREAGTSPAHSIAGALRTIGVRHVAVLMVVLVYAWVASPFFVYQFGGPQR